MKRISLITLDIEMVFGFVGAFKSLSASSQLTDGVVAPS